MVGQFAIKIAESDASREAIFYVGVLGVLQPDDRRQATTQVAVEI